MGTELRNDYRVRCMECREVYEGSGKNQYPHRQDFPTEEEAKEYHKEHNEAFHNNKSVAEIGKFYQQHNYWGFPL